MQHRVGPALCSCGDEALFLRRSAQCGNPGTWGLPGGNADDEDRGQLLATALREAGEEVGGLPEGLQVAGQVLTRWGGEEREGAVRGGGCGVQDYGRPAGGAAGVRS